MSFTNKVLKSAGVAVAAFAMSQAAHAGVATGFNVLDGNGNTLAANVTSFDWAESGSGLAVGVGAPSTLVVGTNFTFEYQAVLGNYTMGTSPYSGNGLNQNYEITVVATIGEIISSVVPKAGGNTAVEFQATGGTLKLYYSAVNADVAAGTGFDDGVLIATFNVLAGGNSTLTTFNGDGVAGGFTQYNLAAVLGSINSNYLTAATGITGMDFTSSQTLPVGTSATDQVNGVDSDSGILLKVDGSSTLTTSPATVPEPSILALMSLGLLGLGFGARRRKS